MVERAVSMEEHWQRVYELREPEKLGWFEKLPVKSLELVARCNLQRAACILDVGSGASTLIDALLDEGFTNIISTDLSRSALDISRARLGEARAAHVRWIADDITNPKYLSDLTDVYLWHDRAVLHFLHLENQLAEYRSTLQKGLRRGGYAIIAAFSLNGAKMCSGLPIRRYDAQMLIEFLGSDFELKTHFEYLYHTPSGAPRPYIYTLFQRLR